MTFVYLSLSKKLLFPCISATFIPITGLCNLTRNQTVLCLFIVFRLQNVMTSIFTESICLVYSSKYLIELLIISFIFGPFSLKQKPASHLHQDVQWASQLETICYMNLKKTWSNCVSWSTDVLKNNAYHFQVVIITKRFTSTPTGIEMRIDIAILIARVLKSAFLQAVYMYSILLSIFMNFPRRFPPTPCLDYHDGN